MKNLFELILAFLKKIFGIKEPSISNESETVVSQENGSEEEIEEIIEQIENNTEENENIMEEYNGTVILLDNGHASSTPGKCSPLFEDGTRFREYEFNRDIVSRIVKKLDETPIKYHVLVPEVEYDVPLTERARRANQYCDKYGTANCLFISVHANAAGNGDWMNARGWSVWTTRGVTKSDAVATIFYEEAEKLLPKYGMTLRKDTTDGDPDYESNFTVIYNTKCRAILTENLFMDNKTDVAFLNSEEGRNVIAQIHVNAIKRICGLS